MDLNFIESNSSDDESLMEDVGTLVEESDVEMPTEDIPCVEDRPDVSCVDDRPDVSCVDDRPDVPCVEDRPDVPCVEDRPECGPHRKLSRGEDLFKFRKEVKLARERKFICSLDLFLKLFEGSCKTPDCDKALQVKHHFVGTTLVVNTWCKDGHTFRFASSEELNGMFSNNLQAAAAILLSGNNFSKVSRMADFMGLSFLSSSTFYRMQRLYLFPAVEEWWSWMREELVKEFAGSEVVVGGDGQCDSPGFSAKNLCYFLMEITSSYILEIEVRDKRHVGLASTNMEKDALKNALSRLKNVLNVVELATDASSSIKKLIANEFGEVFHSLDVWHKSKSIRKCLAKIGQAKSMSKIKAWSDAIIKHFWYCCCVCKQSESTSDEEALKVMKDKWIGLLHHVCDSHVWLSGKCDHEDQVHNPSLPWFDRRDNDYAELQKIILNPELLESFKYYVRFR
ncbi:uncharacterized protein [Montipora capricornis]